MSALAPDSLMRRDGTLVAKSPRMLLRALVVLLVALLPSRALADENKRSYAAPVVIVDAALVTSYSAAAWIDPGNVKYSLWGELSGAGYLLGAPVVHLVHGRPLAALGSLGLHAAVPFTTMFAFMYIGGSCGDGDSVSGCRLTLYSGAMLGVAIATTVDALVLARKTVEPTPGKDASRASWPIEVSPMAWATKGGGVAGVVGAF